VTHFFTLLKGEVIDPGIPARNIFNFDEKGIQLGGGRKNIRTKYIFSATDVNRYVKKSDNLVLVTILECVSAARKSCPPTFFIYSFLRLCTDANARVVASENGWMDDTICADWFERVFVPWAKTKSDPAYPIIFISDEHGSHETNTIRLITIQNHIKMISLPPHTTHKLQPLDVGVFAPLQHKWGKHCNALTISGNEVTRDTVVEEYMAVSLYFGHAIVLC
ncbi:hypothetical protein M422DRAFT_150437, partial [Sphaerobolus stellatus SS14]